MSKLNFNLIVLAASLAFSAGAMARGMSKSDYQASKANIAADYKSDRQDCASLSDNAKDICRAEAKGKMRVEQADLEAVRLLEDAARDGFPAADLPAVESAVRLIRASAAADHALAESTTLPPA